MAQFHQMDILFPYLFHLREQIHGYLDVFEYNQHKICEYLGMEVARELYREKDALLEDLDICLWHSPIPEIWDDVLFAPLQTPWLVYHSVSNCLTKRGLLQYLMEAEYHFQRCVCDALEFTPARECSSTAVFYKLLEASNNRMSTLIGL